MESESEEKAALIAGIESEARAEEERILQEAEEQASEKREYAAKKVESILNEARQKAEEQAETIKRKAVGQAELELKRRSLRMQDAVMRDIMTRAEQRLRSMIDKPEYAGILVNWITEAATGLGAASAKVNASEKERSLINDGLLSEAANRVQEKTGKRVELALSESRALTAQGVVLTAADGRVAFNNQVPTRLLRNQRKIRALIYNSLFSDDREEQL
jgi:vacuolar-type H+-ATPase subunit E/Vma4